MSEDNAHFPECGIKTIPDHSALNLAKHQELSQNNADLTQTLDGQ